MVDDPDKFPYASDPEPINVHFEIKTLLTIFGIAFVLNIISDILKLCIPIDTGCRRKLVNVLKGTHIFTLLAMCYGTYVWFSRAGKICSCRVYPIEDPSITPPIKKSIHEDACFGKYTNLYEDLIWTLWGLLVLSIIGALIFFCTNVCQRCKQKLEEDE